MATARATPMMRTSWYWMLIPTNRNWPDTMLLTCRSVVGLHTMVATPVRITISPRVTMTGRSEEAPCRRRIRTRSTRAPAIEAPTTRTIRSDSSTGTWWAETSSQ